MRIAAVLAVVVCSTGIAYSQTPNLTEVLPTKDCTRVTLITTVDGEQIYFQDGVKKSAKIQLTAGHRYVEKILAIHDKTGLAAKAARQYEAAKRTVTFAGNPPKEAALRVDRALVIAQRAEQTPLAYSLGGPFFREELDLVGDHFDTLGLVGLLPGKAAAIGSDWKLGNDAALALCSFEGLESHELTGKLDAVNGNEAKISITGIAKGIETGAATHLTVTATATYDLTLRKIIALDWKQEVMRDQGPVSPGFQGTVTVKITREPVEEPKALADAALAAVSAGFDVPAGLTSVQYRDPLGRFELNHPRDWWLNGVQGAHTVLRLMDRGDFIAQANITVKDKAAAGQHEDPKQFKDNMLNSPGWQFGELLEEGEVKSTIPGRYIYRVSATGTIDNKQVVQTFFLVAGAHGDQVVVVFQTGQQNIGKLGARDISVIEGINFPAGK